MSTSVYVHHVKGRLRLKDSTWKGHDRRLDEVSSELATVPGVNGLRRTR